MSDIITSAEVNDWLLDLKIDEKSATTIASYKQGVMAFIGPSGIEVTRAAVRQHLAGMDGAASTRALRLAHIKIFCQWLKSEGLIGHDPTRGMNPKWPDPKVVEPLRPAEVNAIIAACKSVRDRAIVMTLADSGMRISELAGIQVKDIDLVRQQVIVHGKRTRGSERWRAAPLSNRAAREISRYLRQRQRTRFADDPALWTGERGPMSVKGVAAVLRRAATRAGVSQANPHRYRHSFANDWLAKGGSEQGAMTILGWRDPKMLSRYSAAGKDARAQAEYHRLMR